MAFGPQRADGCVSTWDWHQFHWAACQLPSGRPPKPPEGALDPGQGKWQWRIWAGTTCDQNERAPSGSLSDALWGFSLLTWLHVRREFQFQLWSWASKCVDRTYMWLGWQSNGWKLKSDECVWFTLHLKNLQKINYDKYFVKSTSLSNDEKVLMIFGIICGPCI